MKNKILILLSFALAFTYGCDKEKLHGFLIEDEAINFYIPKIDWKTSNPYPDELKGTREMFKTVLGYDTIWIQVQIQGTARDYERKLAFKIDSVEVGKGMELKAQSFTLEAGQTTARLPLLAKTLAWNTETTVHLTFDLDKCDFIGGVEERQHYVVTAHNNLTMEALGMTEVYWNWDYVGVYGSWNMAKARFIVYVTGLTNFATLPGSSNSNDAAAMKTKLNDALAEYKEKSAADPDMYPPLYDETKLPTEVWISIP